MKAESLSALQLRKGVTIVTGIDTDIGKTAVTAEIYHRHLQAGDSIITHKLIQTGCSGISEDVLFHREYAGVGLLAEDRAGLTSPVVFSHPCSPHLAAKIDGREADLPAIFQTLEELERRFDFVLSEGAGGLMVPVDGELLLVDLIKDLGVPVILVTSPRLGSLNHTLLSLEALESRGIALSALVYNEYGTFDPLILEDSAQYMMRRLGSCFPDAQFVRISRLPV